MAKASRPYQIFAKPIGSICNLSCDYCYYLKKQSLYPDENSFRMPDDILEEYILQHIETSPDPVIPFSWHGGEPALLGLDYFHKIVELQRKHQPSHRQIINGIQTNGTLIDEGWCRFLAAEGFAVGISLDGPQEMHDSHRLTKGGKPTHCQAMRGYELLREHRIACDILCVVHAHNVHHPAEVYRFFKQIKATYIGFLPLVESRPDIDGDVSSRTVPSEAFGAFLCTIFDEWMSQDIGKTKIQIFEEAARTALGQEHTLCIFKKSCGDVPVIEHNGDFFACDHFVDKEHHLGNIRETRLVDLIESPTQRAFGQIKWDTLPRYCLECEVLPLCNGGCPKDRILRTLNGEAGLNYLCAGYKRFFTHCRPFLAELSVLRNQETIQGQMPPRPAPRPQAHLRIGRNDPCPCGSGKKYKKCCMGKSTALG
ncbi:MAG: anaerobic sulfatase maturase [Deltaproteobacteria bacterium]|nr:anaerobic sulfatase maturase [Deltaproteobacteria bacterium]